MLRGAGRAGKARPRSTFAAGTASLRHLARAGAAGPCHAPREKASVGCTIPRKEVLVDESRGRSDLVSVLYVVGGIPAMVAFFVLLFAVGVKVCGLPA